MAKKTGNKKSKVKANKKQNKGGGLQPKNLAKNVVNTSSTLENGDMGAVYCNGLVEPQMSNGSRSCSPNQSRLGQLPNGFQGHQHQGIPSGHIPAGMQMPIPSGHIPTGHMQASPAAGLPGHVGSAHSVQNVQNVQNVDLIPSNRPINDPNNSILNFNANNTAGQLEISSRLHPPPPPSRPVNNCVHPCHISTTSDMLPGNSIGNSGGGNCSHVNGSGVHNGLLVRVFLFWRFDFDRILESVEANHQDDLLDSRSFRNLLPHHPPSTTTTKYMDPQQPTIQSRET